MTLTFIPKRLVQFLLLTLLFLPPAVKAQTFHVASSILNDAFLRGRITEWGRHGIAFTGEHEIQRYSSDLRRISVFAGYSKGSVQVKIQDLSITTGEDLCVLGFDKDSIPLMFSVDTLGHVGWAVGLDSNLIPRTMAIDRDSNIFVTGVDTGYRPFLMKLDGNGNILFTRQYQVPGWTSSRYLNFCPDGGFLLGTDGVMVKTNALGTVLWHQTGAFREFVVSGTGDIFAENTDTIGGNSGAVVMRFSPTGQFITGRLIDLGNGTGKATAIALARNGDVFLSGWDQQHIVSGSFSASAGIYMLDSTLSNIGYSQISGITGGEWTHGIPMGVSMVVGAGRERGGLASTQIEFSMASQNGFCNNQVFTGQTVLPVNITTSPLGTISNVPLNLNSVPITVDTIYPTYTYNSPVFNLGICQCSPANCDFRFTVTGDTVSFLAGGNDITDVIWDFGDGTSSTSYRPIHQYACSGTYNVCMKGLNRFCGNWDSLCVQIVISGTNPPLSAQFVADTTSMPTSFTDLSSPSGAISSWDWDFGDGNTSTIQSPVHTYANPGAYQACLTISDNCQNDTLCKTLNICPPDTLGINYLGPVNPFACDTITLEAPLTGVNYSWNTGDTSRQIQVTTTGTYVVSQSIAGACSYQDTFNLQVLRAPVTWGYLIGSAALGDTLFRTVPGNSSWGTSRASSLEYLPSNTNGRLTHVVHSANKIYFLGLSAQPSYGNQARVDHAFFVQNGNLEVREASGTNIGLGGVSNGDTLAIARIGNSLLWFLNGTQVHATTVNPATGLHADASLRSKNMYLTQTEVDFCGFPPIQLNGEVRHDLCANSPIGSINLQLSGGVPPFSISWSTGDTTSLLDSLPAGTYSVTVTDQQGQTAQQTYQVNSRVTWIGLIGATANEDSLTRTTPQTGWGGSGARSLEVLPPNTDGELSHLVSNTNKYYFLGLSNSDPDAIQSSVDFTIGNLKGTIRILEKSGFSVNFGTVSVGDTLKIRRVGSQITYLRNSTVLRTVNVNPGQFLFADASLYNSGFLLADVFTDFCQTTIPLSISGTVTHTSCFQNNGAIDLRINSGTPPISYLWNDGTITEDRNGIGSGFFKVVVTDGAGAKDSISFQVLDRVKWEEFIGTAAQGDTLFRTLSGPGSWGTSGARSDNKLLGGSDGRMYHIIQRINKYYYLGLSNADPDAFQTTIDFAFFNGKGVLKIREEAGNFVQTYGTIAIGDTLLIERDNGTIRYFRNGSLLRSTPAPLSDTLRVDASLFSPGTEISGVFVDFCDTVAGMKTAPGGEGSASLEQEQIQLFPNPASRILNIRTGSAVLREWEILDLAGRKLASGKANSAEFSLDIAQLTNGVYFLKVQSEASGKVTWLKWIKQ